MGLIGTLMLAALTLPAEDPAPVTATNQPAGDAPQTEAAPALGPSYDDFKLVTERNIFDPNRRAALPPQPQPERPPEPRVDIVALTGTLSYAKGTFAFFDSNSSEFRKTARVGDEVAGYTLKEIEQSHVALEGESKLLELKVGQQLRRQDQGAWELTYGALLNQGRASSRDSSRRPGPSSRSISGSNPAGTADAAAGSQADDSVDDSEDTPAASEDSGDGPSEALKRLLEQRRKEQEQ